MTEEFIPRDTPIYCFVANNEKDLDRARQTRDVWTKRWGYTNFIIQERLETDRIIDSYLQQRHPDDLNIFKEKANNTDNYYSLNFLYLIEKLKNKPQHSIIIQSNTILTNDLPKHYLNNHISFLSLSEQGKFDIRNGLMVSRVWCEAFDQDFRQSFSNLNIEKINHMLDINFYNLFIISYYNLTKVLNNCKHNIDDLQLKTKEEMHATLV